MEALIFLTTFAAVSLLVLYLGQRNPDVVRRRILEGATPNDLARQHGPEGGPVRRLVQPAVRRVGAALNQLLPQNLISDIEKALVRAGEPLSLGTFLTLWATIVAVSAFATFLLVGALADLGIFAFLAGGLFLFYGVVTPYLLLGRRARRRTRRIERELPDALDLMLTCVEAGLGVDAAFALVAQRSRGPLAEALTDYLRQVGLGRMRRDALEDIAQRTGAEGLAGLAATVSQSAAIGTSMGDVLRLQAAELREARRLKAQEAASRAPILMTIPLALCFMPAMIAVVVVPAIFNIIDFVGGGFKA